MANRPALKGEKEMSTLSNEQEKHFMESLAAVREALPLGRPEKLSRLLSHVDALCRSPEGLRQLYRRLPEGLADSVFQQNAWSDPSQLVPSLVGGTLLAGHPTSTLEVLSELRMIAIAEGLLSSETLSPEAARNFLTEALVSNFDLAFDSFSSESWSAYPAGELKKVRHLFAFLVEHVPLDKLKKKLEEEVSVLTAHRPLSTWRLEKILKTADQHLKPDPADPADEQLLDYIDALLRPTLNASMHPRLKDYSLHLATLDRQALEKECRQMGAKMAKTGLVSLHHVALLRFAADHRPDFIPILLQLDDHGQVEFERHRSFVIMLIKAFIVPATKQAAYGLGRILDRNLLSRPISWNALNRLLRIQVHPRIAEMLLKSNHSEFPATAIQLLVGGLLAVLGQPLGLRQGNNPTCQSARAISMWSRHAPGKLINMLVDAAVADNIAFRYEGELIESSTLQEGLIRQFDYKLDSVSVVLVPHLDKIYNAMMTRASQKHPTEDPHSSVNPSFYGQWIPTGFISAYNPALHAIYQYDRFVRVFYASFHPDYNGGNHLVYPMPLGIFVTDAGANMLGFHAISLLRIARDRKGHWRAYFFNPNSEGRQNWGQDIRPSVKGHGEEPGESSLPVPAFISRVYAYHYNSVQLGSKPKAVPAAIVDHVRQLARESWGRKYHWSTSN